MASRSDRTHPRLPTLLALALAACSGDDTATTSATTTDATATASTTGETAAGTTASTTEATTAGSGSDSATAGTTASTTEVTTSSTTEATTAGTTAATTAGTTAGTTEATTAGTTEATTGDTTTTGGDLCAFPGSETVFADLVDLDKKVVCGALLFNGVVGPLKGDTWELENCPCDSECFVEDPWTLTVDMPAGLAPDLPACARIEVVTVPGFAPDTCEFQSLTIWDTTVDIDNQIPSYAAGRVKSYASPPLAVASDLLQECECDFCCNKSEAHELTFAVGDQELTLGEATMGVIDGAPKMEAHNLQSHLSGLCDAPPDFHWLMRAVR